MIRDKLKNHKESRLRILRAISVPTILLVWFFITQSGIVKPLYLPHPAEVLGSLHDIGFTAFLHHVEATVLRVLIGFLSGSLFGIFVGLSMSFSRYAEAALYNLIESWRPIPPVALIPFFILWFGFSEFGKVLLVFLGCTLIMIVNTYEAVRNVRPIYKRAAYCLGAKEFEVFLTVITYAILPDLIAGLRIALATSIGLVIVSEFMGADHGLGYLISISKVTFSTHTIFLGILVVGFMSWILDFLLRGIMNYLTRWKERATEAIG